MPRWRIMARNTATNSSPFGNTSATLLAFVMPASARSTCRESVRAASCPYEMAVGARDPVEGWMRAGEVQSSRLLGRTRTFERTAMTEVAGE